MNAPSAAPATSPSRVYVARGLHGRVIEALAARIVGRDLPAGGLLPREDELGRGLGASRTAVREAVKILAAKGLVETRRRRGTVVRPPREWNLLDPDVLAWIARHELEPDLIDALVELRRLIEPAAARLACARHDAATLGAIAAALERMRGALDDPTAYYEADLAFHRAIFAAAGNPFLDRLGGIVCALLAVSFGLQQRSLIPFELGLELHARVLGRLVERDAVAAERAMVAVIDEARVELERAAAERRRT